MSTRDIAGYPVLGDPESGAPWFILLGAGNVPPRHGLTTIRDEVRAAEVDLEADRLVERLDARVRQR
jgi:hypothetical protein